MTSRGRRAARLAVAGVVLAVVAAGGFVAWRRPRPNLIVVVVDTLRADRLAAYGNRRGLTPFLDELARRGTVFAHAYAGSSWTCPSVASLLTSRLPTEHGVTTYDAVLPAREVTLPEVLAPPAHGRLRQALAGDYLTGGITGNFRLTAALGYAQGFRTWRALGTMRKPRGTSVTHKALAWAETANGRWWNRWLPRPVFLYLQYMDPHAPYEPRPALAARFVPRGDGFDPATLNKQLVDMSWEAISPAGTAQLSSLYDAEVAQVDAALAGLFAGLDARGLLRDAVVVVTGDHGEEFRDHGLLEHGLSLYNETLEVPLLVSVRDVPRGRVVPDAVSLLDVAPTLLDLAGIPAERRFEGRSLVPLLRGERWPPRVVEADLLPSVDASSDIALHFAAVVGPRKKLILRRHPMAFFGGLELYDLALDPAEKLPQPIDGSPDVRPLVLAIRGAKARIARRRSGPAETAPVDDETRKRLRALGYVN